MEIREEEFGFGNSVTLKDVAEEGTRGNRGEALSKRLNAGQQQRQLASLSSVQWYN